MPTILVTGALGQIGSELVPALRARYGADTVIATDLKVLPPSGAAALAPYGHLDCTRARTSSTRPCAATTSARSTISPRLLSASPRTAPQLAWSVNMGGLYNVLEVAAAVPLRRVLPELHRRVRADDAARSNAAGDRAAADDDVRRDQGRGRAVVRLLRAALRHRRAGPAAAGSHLLCRGRRAAARRTTRSRFSIRPSATGSTPASCRPDTRST